MILGCFMAIVFDLQHYRSSSRSAPCRGQSREWLCRAALLMVYGRGLHRGAVLLERREAGGAAGHGPQRRGLMRGAIGLPMASRSMHDGDGRKRGIGPA